MAASRRNFVYGEVNKVHTDLQDGAKQISLS